MKLAVFLSCFIAAAFTVGNSEWTPFNPEETLFTYTRCMEDHFKKDYSVLPKWVNWELPEDNEKSACYAKCVLTGLGLFDEDSHSFKADHILEQHNAYKSYSGQDDEGAKEFKEAVQALSVDSSDCKSVMEAYKPVHDKYKDVTRNIYFGKKEITDKIYESDSSVKKRDESIFRFCERTNGFADGSEELCDLRKSGKTTNNAHLDCVLRGLRYLDRNGNINPDEVKRDLHLVEITDKDDAVDNALGKCQAKESTKALDYNNCLWNDEQLKDVLMKAFDYREIRSTSYRYFLGQPKSYNADEMRAQVQKIDKEAGC